MEPTGVLGEWLILTPFSYINILYFKDTITLNVIESIINTQLIKTDQI